MADTLVKAKCHCGSSEFLASFQSTNLPIPTSICHCNSCRHATGQTHAIYAELSGPPLAPSSSPENHIPSDLGGMKSYASSAKGTRYFCGTCGAHMLFKDEKKGPVVWEVSAGVLEKFEGIVKIDRHIHIGDTVDGGISDHIHSVDGVELPRYRTRPADGSTETVPPGWKDLDKESAADRMLHFYCHCKSIDLYLQRPSKISDPKTQWYLAPGATQDDAVRYYGEYCFCTSCRITSGSIVGTWTYIPVKEPGVYLSPSPSSDCALDLASSSPSHRPRALKQYNSSPTVFREFCETCGATVFYRREVEGRDFMDIATGLVDEDRAGGVRAETWFKWPPLPDDGRAYEEDSTSKALVDAIRAGVRAQ